MEESFLHFCSTRVPPALHPRGKGHAVSISQFLSAAMLLYINIPILFCLLALKCSDPRWSTFLPRTITGYGCFVLIDRYRHPPPLSSYSISLVCGMYTMLSKPTLFLIYSIYPLRPLSSCLPHWNSNILSIPAFSASTFSFSFLASRFLVCLHARLLLVIGLLSVASSYFSASTASSNAIGFTSWFGRFVSLLSFHSSYVSCVC
jgi:hypothetical protein